jgi:hypothetical protein
MPKSESELPEDISARLDEAIAECMDELRNKVARMFRFANMNVVKAAVIILSERGTPMKRTDVLEEMKKGGIWRPPSGSKGSGADSEMLRGLSKGANAGVNLKWVDEATDVIWLAKTDINIEEITD